MNLDPILKASIKYLHIFQNKLEALVLRAFQERKSKLCPYVLNALPISLKQGVRRDGCLLFWGRNPSVSDTLIYIFSVSMLLVIKFLFLFWEFCRSWFILFFPVSTYWLNVFMHHQNVKSSIMPKFKTNNHFGGNYCK